MASSDTEDSEDGALNMFDEPGDYYEPEKPPTTVTHTLLDGREITLNLVGHSALWGHHLWQAAQITSTYLQKHPHLVHGKTVLELGAAAGLPSILSSFLGAKFVLATDYPEEPLIANLDANLELNCPTAYREEGIKSCGHLWGRQPSELLTYIPPINNPNSSFNSESDSNDTASERRFDFLILADLLFNHSQHSALLHTIKCTLSKPTLSGSNQAGTAFVTFSPYRPHLLSADLAFFDLAREAGFQVEKLFEEMMPEVMFPDDRGDEEVRRKVFGYTLTWPPSPE